MYSRRPFTGHPFKSWPRRRIREEALRSPSRRTERRLSRARRKEAGLRVREARRPPLASSRLKVQLQPPPPVLSTTRPAGRIDG